MIGFNLTEEQKEMQAFFRKFSQERVKAAAEKMDEEEKMDMDLIHEMQSLGMFGIPFSEEVGGAGLDVFNYVLLMEELSKVDASTSITVSVHTSLCASSIEEFATPEQKEKWLRPLADGSKISVRPSGTEPKIKFYFEARAQMKDVNEYERAQQEANARIDAIIKDLKLQ